MTGKKEIIPVCTFRCDPVLIRKFAYIALRYDMSRSELFEEVLNKFVAVYEKECGVIEWRI